MTQKLMASFPWLKVIVPCLVIIVSFIVGLLGKNVLFYFADKHAKRTRWRWDEIIVKSIHRNFLLWCVLGGCYLCLGLVNFSPQLTTFLTKILLAGLIISFILFFINLASRLMVIYSIHVESALPVTPLTQAVVKLAIFLLGSLILLNTLGISITPILTTLGVGGLAVALALQDTLANFFAGFYTTMAKQIRVGDYIKLDSGEEGYVEEIGWRTTKLRMIPNNIVLIPNSKLSQAIVTNYSLPEKKMALFIPVGVSYEAEPEKVERILLEVATTSAQEIKGLLSEPKPKVRFMPGFGDFSLDFTLICYIKEFVDQYLVQHELRKRIFKRFKEEGIEIPFPIRTIYMKKEEK